MDKIFDGYATITKNIPWIDAYQFANDLRKGQDATCCGGHRITDYCGHILAASRRNYMIIGHVAFAFGYNAREIEHFVNKKHKGIEYFYFMLEPFRK